MATQTWKYMEEVVAMRATEVLMPEALWLNPGLTDGAKLLWCFLCAKATAKQHTYGELRRGLRISQNSLLKYLRTLQERGWLSCRKTGLRTVAVEVVRPESFAGFRVPTDLLFDPDLPRPAVWVWCIIRRHGAPFGYRWLQGATGYRQPTLSKYLRQLRATGWLTGGERRVRHFIEFHLTATNPRELQRKADIAELEQGVELAKRAQGYSAGQYALARMVKLRLAKGTVIENAEVTGLDNLETGGRMHYDIFIPEYKVAIEFHGPQHFGPTERFPDVAAFRAQRMRDLIKLGRSYEQGITLLVITAADLRFDRLDKLLAPYVPLREEQGDQWHIHAYLKRLAAAYRTKAPSVTRPA